MPFGISAKIMTIGAGILALILGALLIKSSIENREITKQRNDLQTSITDPKTGYVARLAQANSNIITLKTAIQRQNASFQAESDRGKAELARLKKELAMAQRESADLRRRVASFMATKPQGATLEDRVKDIDNRILEDLQK